MQSSLRLLTSSVRPAGAEAVLQPRRSARISRQWGRGAPCRPSASAAGGSGSSGGEPEPPASSSSSTNPAEAYQLLGLQEGASYDEVLRAKKRLLERHAGNESKCTEVEEAYDLILMRLMKARMSGDLPVSATVRFADVVQTRPVRKRRAAGSSGGSLLPGFGRSGSSRGGGGGGVTIGAPPSGPLTTTTALVFGGLVAWTLVQGLTEPSPAAAVRDVPGIQLALGCAASLYLLRESKRTSLPKALGITLAGLVAGTLVGAALESWLRVDLSPLGGLSSPGIVVGEFSLIGLAAAALFLG